MFIRMLYLVEDTVLTIDRMIVNCMFVFPKWLI